jgi:hypothetical protein
MSDSLRSVILSGSLFLVLTPINLYMIICHFNSPAIMFNIVGEILLTIGVIGNLIIWLGE